MKWLAILQKTLRENLREWKILVLALSFGPFFVSLMYAFYGGGLPTYKLAVVDGDPRSACAPLPAQPQHELIGLWKAATNTDGGPQFLVETVASESAAHSRVVERELDLLTEIPAGFSCSLRDPARPGPPPRLRHHAVLGNPRAAVAMALVDGSAFGHAYAVSGLQAPLDVEVRQVDNGKATSEFDLYVPALLVLALVMILFTAAATLVREVDKGTLIRLQLSMLPPGQWLSAVATMQVALGVVGVALTWASAAACGYRSDGSLLALSIVTPLAALSVVAMALWVAAWLPSMYALLTVGTFPFLVLMFLSGCMFPVPNWPALQVAGHTVFWNDLLPTATAVRTIGKILSFGAGVRDVAGELLTIAVVTAVWWLGGSTLFVRRHWAGR